MSFPNDSDMMPGETTTMEDKPEDPPSNGYSLPKSDLLSTDWSEWMRFDDPDDDEIDLTPNQLEPSSSPTGQSNEGTVAPADLDASIVKPEFSVQGTVSPTHIRGASDGSVDGGPFPSPSSFTSPQPISSHMWRDNTQSQNAPYLQDQHLRTSTANQPVVNAADVLLSPVSSTQSTRKRKSSQEGPTDETAPCDNNVVPAKKRSHNVIEKRYRANLNDKIAELRDSVPSLRGISRQGGSDDPNGHEEETAAAGSTNKLNKASILSKATEYIKHLEVRNKRLDEENMALKNRLRDLDQAGDQSILPFGSKSGVQSSSDGSTTSPEPPMGSSTGVNPYVESERSSESSSDLYPPEGLIKVPDAFRRMREGSTNSPNDTASSQSPDPSRSSGERSGRPRGVANKFMLGTLAGLMIVGGLENRKSTDSSEKGLFGLPFHMLGEAFGYTQKYINTVKDTTSWHIRALSQFAITSLLLFGCAFLVFVYLFNSGPRGARISSKRRARQARSTGISSEEFRREAWLTSIQTVGVPSHTFFPEWFAVTSRCLEYYSRCLLGWRLYSWITGISEDDERGRVKAWDIALDAQLTGGDAEVSKSRLVLTIFASGTLPQSPARCILKALHIRVLLWRVGEPKSFTYETANQVAFALARYQWRLAQAMQHNLPADHEDSLPSHLAFLLAMDSDEVLTDSIIQRSSNMIWNRSTQEATEGEGLLDVVAEDTAVRSPLDALSAWWSSRALQRALMQSFDQAPVGHDPAAKGEFGVQLGLALKSAPVTSTAYTRAIAINAVFFNESRVENINSVLSALQRTRRKSTSNTAIFVDTSVPVSARGEISAAVRCAMIAAILQGQVGADSSSVLPSPLTQRGAVELFNKIPVNPVELTLLGFASLYRLLQVVASDERLFPSCSLSSSMCSSFSETGAGDSESKPNSEETEDPAPIPDLARLATGLIYWVRNAYNPVSSGLTTDIVESVVDGCVEACRNAGIVIDVDAIMQSAVQSHSEKATPTISTDNAEGDSTKTSSNKEAPLSGSRRGSVKSSDTGYGSLETEDGKEDKKTSSHAPPEEKMHPIPHGATEQKHGFLSHLKLSLKSADPAS